MSFLLVPHLPGWSLGSGEQLRQANKQTLIKIIYRSLFFFCSCSLSCSRGFLALCFSPCILSLCLPLLIHTITHHSFADDLKLQMSAPPDKISELLHSMQSFASDVKAWATANMLRLDGNRTELMLVTSKRTKHLIAYLLQSLLAILKYVHTVCEENGVYIRLSSYCKCTCLQYCSDMLL